MTISLVAVFIPVLFLGGDHRPAAARVFHHHRGRGVDLRLHFADLDAHALQPLPASRESSDRRVLSLVREIFRLAEQHVPADSCYGSCGIGALLSLASIVLTVATVYLFVIMPKGFMPTVDQGFAVRRRRSGAGRFVRRNGPPASASRTILAKNPWIEAFGSGNGRDVAARITGFCSCVQGGQAPAQGQRDYRAACNSSSRQFPA